MKRLALLFVFCGMLMTAMADWTYGTAYFKGNQPSNCLSHGKMLKGCETSLPIIILM